MYTEEKPDLDYLAHYGVKGMKWGVRKNPSRTYAKASKKTTKHYNKWHAYLRKSGESIAAAGYAKNLRSAKKLQKKGMRYLRLAENERLKGRAFAIEFEETFKNISVNQITEKDLSVGKQYVEILLDYSKKGG